MSFTSNPPAMIVKFELQIVAQNYGYYGKTSPGAEKN
jgi:hypothetical protein